MKGEGLSVYVKGFANKIGEFFFLKVLQSKKNTYFCNPKSCESSSVGRARPCQGRGRRFETGLSLQVAPSQTERVFF